MNSERQFLVEFCRTVFNESDYRPTIYEDLLDEEKLFRLGLYHQILPLINHHRTVLSQAFPQLSADFFEKCRLYAVTNAGRVMLYENFLARFDRRLSERGVEYRLFKGPVLAFELYQYPHLRTFGDMDILIREEALETVHQILSELGCELCDDLYKVFPNAIIRKYSFARHYATIKNPFVAIDVHLSLSGRLHPFQFNVDDFWENSRSFRIGERDYRTFDHPHQALYSLYHSFKHYFFKLVWLIDCRRNFQMADFDMQSFRRLLKKYNLSKIWGIYEQVARDLEEGEYPGKKSARHLFPQVNAGLVLQGVMPTTPARARMLLPLLYLPRLHQKITYLWQQLFPPRDVVRDFYVSQNLKPTWRNYLRLRRRAMRELFND
ncbi:MAG: nucleotidyltransferase family protein [Candidatus Neomarinimicrobiota bacterium]